MQFIDLRDKPEIKEKASIWFHEKWGVPTEAYLECMNAYLNHENDYGWYLCLDGEEIIGGLGVRCSVVSNGELRFLDARHQ